MKLAQILGYQLDITARAALRELHRALAGSPLSPPMITALLQVAEHPGCDQTTLGRALAGNRSLGMKIASALEEKGLLTRDAGRDRRSKGLHLTAAGRQALEAVLPHHRRADAALAAGLAPGEREMLLHLLAKVLQSAGERESEAIRFADPAGNEAASTRFAPRC